MLESILDVPQEWVIELEQDDIDLAGIVGRYRSKEMASVADKPGYSKIGYHLNWQNDMLGAALEVAFVRRMQRNPLDNSVITLWEPRGSRNKYQPDVLGKYELRRVEHFGTGVKMKAKDVESDAYVISGIVDHVCSPETGEVILTGRVTFLEWQNAVEDYPKSHFSNGLRVCTPLKRRTMDSLPLIVGVL